MQRFIKYIYCKNGCCKLFIRNFIQTNHTPNYKLKTPKAGIVITNTHQKLLVVQSRGLKWGPPKGSYEECDNNNPENCAIREVEEETGIIVNKSDMVPFFKVDRTTYFYIKTDIEFDKNKSDSGISGIGWINPSCLLDMYNNSLLDLNYHCKRCVSKII